MTKHVAVLMGGWNSEREVSLVSGRDCADALEEKGYRVSRIDAGRDIAQVLAEMPERPNVVFNALHGRFGEDGCIQGLLEILGLPYTHSGPLASALAMNKDAAKLLYAGAGIRCPEGRIATRDEIGLPARMDRPFVVKPNQEGSSVGVRIVEENDNDDRLIKDDFRYGDEVLVETFIPGRELTVAVMGERPLGVTEIRITEGFYDYHNKYTEGGSRHIVPAPVHDETYARVQDMALRAHRALGCRGVTRADFRYDDTGGEPGALFMLEVNTQPGMTPLSLVPEQAAHVGISFGDLVAWMVEEARCDA
ncbi:MAG: D-alanine--D-alanine ligase [Rhodospirillales bacterium]|nr:D-alanine--D-alanine ligase [Rhodospirillales bacterium]